MLRALLAAVLAGVGVLALAAPASAHASLVSSDPAEGEVLPETPDAVTFTFDEAVSLTSGSVQVFDAAGETVESESSGSGTVVTTDLPDELAEGTYVVTWRVVSADSHPIAGSLTFSIGRPSATVAPPKIADVDGGPLRTVLSGLEALTYLGLLLAGGLALFVVWTAHGVRLPDEVRGRLDRTRRGAAVLAVLTGLLAVPVSGAYQEGSGLSGVLDPAGLDPALVGDDLLVVVLQAVGLLATLLAGRRAVVAVGAVLALASPALVGHSRAYEPVSLLLVTDAAHLLAGATWLGGLVGLVLTLRALSGRERDAATVLSRFSTLAAGTLVLLVATGSLLSWRILGSWSGFVEVAYGRLLLVKIAIVVVVVGIAGWNRYRLLPRVLHGVGHDARRAGARRVGSAVRYEAGLLVLVLGVTGFLVNRSPAESDDVRPIAPSRVEAALAGESRVLATMVPGRRGPNTITVQVQDESGEPLDGFAAPAVVVRGAVSLGEVPVTPVGAGTYRAEVVVPTAGTWEVQVSLRASEFENPVTTLAFDVE